ncbi:putative ankyrin repeat protein RF_0381 [Haliotis cracherodii]|uniref:putative ankyrin repeat protein RF_0381 n=1 Tax=Haliotis cracherodii TaxID=6455 RepID=UPI0039EA7A4C
MPVLARLVDVNPTRRYVPKIYKEENIISPKKKKDITNFLSSVRTGDVNSVKRFLEGGLEADVEGEGKETALTTAVFTENTAMCRLLIEHGCDLNKSGTVPPFYFRLTPLCQAVSGGNTQAVRMLLHAGCKKDLRDDLGRPPLFYSMSCSNEDMLHLLLRSGCDINLGTKDTNYTILHEAVAKGKLDIVKVLLEAGANPNSYEVNQRLTPSFFTTRQDIHELLVKYGSNINHTSRSGDTVLHHAITHGDLPLVEYFLNKGAIIDAIKTTCVVSSHNILQQVNIQDPLQQAATEHYFKICIRLIQHGSSTQFLNSDENDLVTRLLSSENLELILTLLFASGNTNWLKRILSDEVRNHLNISKATRDWLRRLANKVLPLRMIACHTIRQTLKSQASQGSILKDISKLSLPEVMHDCVELKVKLA